MSHWNINGYGGNKNGTPNRPMSASVLPNSIAPSQTRASLVTEYRDVMDDPDRDPVWVSMASIPIRRQALEKVVSAIVPQVDRLNVYLNEYDDVPEFLQHPKIAVARSQDHGNRGDAGKFFWVDDCQGYYLSCDDDIEYPSNYVRETLKVIEHYGRKAVVGWHGAIYYTPFVNEVASRRVISYMAKVDYDTAVHYVGTGVCGFHISTLKVSRDDFKRPNMADTWLGDLCRAQGVPRLIPAHPENWIRAYPEGYGDSIWRAISEKKKSPKNTLEFRSAIVAANMPWPLLPLPTKD